DGRGRGPNRAPRGERSPHSERAEATARCPVVGGCPTRIVRVRSWVLTWWKPPHGKATHSRVENRRPGNGGAPTHPDQRTDPSPTSLVRRHGRETLSFAVRRPPPTTRP